MQFDINDPLGLKPKGKTQEKPNDFETMLRGNAGMNFTMSDPLGLNSPPKSKPKPQTKSSLLGKPPVSDTPVKIRINGGDTRTIVDDKRVKSLQQQVRQMEASIQKLEAAGYDATRQRQDVSNYYLQLQKMQGLPQQIDGVKPRTKAQMEALPDARGIWHTGGYQLTEDKPKADPFDRLPFDYKAFKTMLDNGHNIVELRNGGSLPRNVAERQVSKVTGQQGPFQGAPNLAQRENQINEAGLAPNQNAFTTPNPNQKRFATADQYIGEMASTLSQVYEKSTGLSAEDAPYAHEALNFLGGLITTPMQVAKGAAYGVQHPIQGIKNVPGLIGQAAQSLNVFDPNISGSDRFGRFLNVAATLQGGAHFKSFIKRSIADGSLYRLGAKLGLSEAAATRDAIDFFKKQQEIHGANLDNSNRLGQIALNQSKRNLANGFNIDDPLGLHSKPEQPATPGFRKDPGPIPNKRISPVTYDEHGQPIIPRETDPFGLGIPVDHNTEGIHPTPQFEKPTSKQIGDAFGGDEDQARHEANDQILDKAVRMGLKPEAADFVETHAGDHDSHIHKIWTPEVLDAVAKSKLSGRRQIKALDWFAATQVTDSHLIAQAIDVWENNGVRFTPDSGREPDEAIRRSQTTSEHTDSRPDGGLNRIADQQYRLNKERAIEEANKPTEEAPQSEVTPTPTEPPKAEPKPKTPKEKMP